MQATFLKYLKILENQLKERMSKKRTYSIQKSNQILFFYSTSRRMIVNLLKNKVKNLERKQRD